jgi:DNA repair protein RecO (recombination protein O)
MIVKTKGILLHHIRHTDNSIIAHFYTKDYGKVSMVVKGISSKKGYNRNIYFQPLFLFNLEFYLRESRELQTLKEISLDYTPTGIPVDINKSSIALFLSEMIYAVIREEDVNHQLFDFLESSVIALDSFQEGVGNFHLWFLVHFSSFAGIGPSSAPFANGFFDMANGMFVKTMPTHPEYLEPRLAGILNELILADLGSISRIILSANERIALLEHLVRYYSLHLTGMRHIRSLQILNDVFRK